jgi:hypothetical protein
MGRSKHCFMDCSQESTIPYFRIVCTKNLTLWRLRDEKLASSDMSLRKLKRFLTQVKKGYNWSRLRNTIWKIKFRYAKWQSWSMRYSVNLEVCHLNPGKDNFFTCKKLFVNEGNWLRVPTFVHSHLICGSVDCYMLHPKIIDCCNKKIRQ